MLASGGDDGTVRLWSVAGEEIAVLCGHESHVWSVSFLPYGHTLASASWDGTVLFWDIATTTRRAQFDWRMGQVHAVAFSPDGMTAAAGGENGDIVVWDVDDLLS
jgi:WD40 repeat protein